MGEKSITLFEIHLQEPSFNAPESGPRFFGKKSDDEEEQSEEDHESIEVEDGETETDEAETEDEESVEGDESTDAESGRSVGGSAVVGLLLLVALAVAVKVLMGGEGDIEELDDLADIAVDGDETEEADSAAVDEE